MDWRPALPIDGRDAPRDGRASASQHPPPSSPRVSAPGTEYVAVEQEGAYSATGPCGGKRFDDPSPLLAREQPLKWCVQTPGTCERSDFIVPLRCAIVSRCACFPTGVPVKKVMSPPPPDSGANPVPEAKAAAPQPMRMAMQSQDLTGI